MLDAKLLQDVWQDLENPDKPKFETGFKYLDSLLGIYEGSGALITVGARPAMGKTTFIFTIIENLMKINKKTLLISLEISDTMAVKKLLFQRAEVGLYKQYMDIIQAKDWQNLGTSIEKMEHWNLDICDDSNMNIEQIEEKIKKVKPEVVFIDYFQLIQTNIKKDRYSQIENICINLKRIAKETGVIIIVTSQLSRAVETRFNKRPMLSDLRESGAIENISDVVIFLYREEYYSYREEEEDNLRPKGETEVIIAKNKFGSCGVVHITFKANIPKFYDRSDDFDVL